MQTDIQLIQLFCVICQIYNTKLAADAQRTSNNFLPKFTDEECITVMLWGLANEKFTCKAVHNFTKTFYSDYFPEMPKYKAFNHRIGFLADAIKTLADVLLSELSTGSDCPTHLLDSMPIIMAQRSRSLRAKVAPELCDIGYCETKRMKFYGVKLHVFGQSRYKAMPLPRQMQVQAASVHDIKASTEIFMDVHGLDVFADRAYASEPWKAVLAQNHVTLFTPIKRKPGQESIDSADRLLSTAISKVRQPIESFFNWLQEHTQIQNASKVRSSNGLLSFIFARISLACLFLNHVLSL